MSPYAEAADVTYTLVKLELRRAHDRVLGRVVISTIGAVGCLTDTGRVLDFDGLVPTGFDELDERLEAELKSLNVGETFTSDTHPELGHSLAQAFDTDGWKAHVEDIQARTMPWTRAAIAARLFASP